MSHVPVKYKTSESVMKALGVQSFHDFPLEKMAQFVKMMPQIDKEVALAIIDQLPSVADFGKTAITEYSQTCNHLLQDNQENQQSVIQSYQSVLHTLEKRFESENIQEEERAALIRDMIDIANKIAEADTKNKNFLKDILGYAVSAIGLVSTAVITLACLGRGGGDNTRNPRHPNNRPNHHNKRR